MLLIVYLLTIVLWIVCITIHIRYKGVGRYGSYFDSSKSVFLFMLLMLIPVIGTFCLALFIPDTLSTITRGKHRDFKHIDLWLEKVTGFKGKEKE